jgi:hypothetical protein
MIELIAPDPVIGATQYAYMTRVMLKLNSYDNVAELDEDHKTVARSTDRLLKAMRADLGMEESGAQEPGKEG